MAAITRERRLFRVHEIELKPLTTAGIPGAIALAKQYRLLNEPGVAESICRDVLLVDPDQHEARIVLLLSLSDMFRRSIAGHFEEASRLARDLSEPYERAYYTGIVHERRAKAHHRSHSPASGELAHDWFRSAMELFAEAERLRPAGDDSAILRWNGCVRRLQTHADLRAASAAPEVSPLGDDWL